MLGQAQLPARQDALRGFDHDTFIPLKRMFPNAAIPAPQREQALATWEQAPSARLCHPPRAEEHLLPLMVVAGAAGEGAGQCVFSDRVMGTTLSAFRFD